MLLFQHLEEGALDIIAAVVLFVAYALSRLLRKRPAQSPLRAVNKAVEVDTCEAQTSTAGMVVGSSTRYNFL